MFGIKNVGHAGVLEAHFEMVPLNVVHACGSDVLRGFSNCGIGRAVSQGYKKPQEK